jgi:hypothetical protein
VQAIHPDDWFGSSRRLWFEGKAGLGEESVDEFGPGLDPFEQCLDRGCELIDGAGDEVAQVAFEVRPCAFGRVEVRLFVVGMDSPPHSSFSTSP